MIQSPIFLNQYLLLNSLPILSMSIFSTDWAEMLWKGQKYTFQLVMNRYPQIWLRGSTLLARTLDSAMAGFSETLSIRLMLKDFLLNFQMIIWWVFSSMSQLFLRLMFSQRKRIHSCRFLTFSQEGQISTSNNTCTNALFDVLHDFEGLGGIAPGNLYHGESVDGQF